MAAMVACVEKVCKICIWLFRNVRGEGFDGSSVVRMAQGKICFRLPFCRQEALFSSQADYYAIFLRLKTDGSRAFDRQKKSLYRQSMCHLYRDYVIWVIFDGGISRKIRTELVGFDSTVRERVLHAVLSDQTECGTSWGTA